MTQRSSGRSKWGHSISPYAVWMITHIFRDAFKKPRVIRETLRNAQVQLTRSEMIIWFWDKQMFIRDTVKNGKNREKNEPGYDIACSEAKALICMWDPCSKGWKGQPKIHSSTRNGSSAEALHCMSRLGLKCRPWQRGLKMVLITASLQNKYENEILYFAFRFSPKWLCLSRL